MMPDENKGPSMSQVAFLMGQTATMCAGLSMAPHGTKMILGVAAVLLCISIGARLASRK